jgi:hypothetical protein
MMDFDKYFEQKFGKIELPRYSEDKRYDYLREINDDDILLMSPEERISYDRDLKHFRDAYSLDKTYESILENAKNSMEKGREQGIIEGSIKKAFEI